MNEAGTPFLTQRLGNLVDIVGGGTPSKRVNAFFTGEIPWVTPKDMKRWHIEDAQDNITPEAISSSATRLIQAGAVLVVIRSGVLAHKLPVAINVVPVTLNQDMKALVCRPDLHPPFLARFLQWYSPRVLSAVRGTTAHNIPTDVLREVEIPVPPIAEQRRISDILDKAHGVREKRHSAQEQLRHLAASLFVDMFGDPVRNAKRWPMHKFGDHVTLLQYGPRFFNEKYTPSGVRIVRITDLDFQGNLDYSAMPTLDVADDDRERFQLLPGDLLLARSGATVGKTALISDDAPECIAGAYFIRLRFDDAVLPLYAQMLLRTAPLQRIIAERSRQSAQQNFNGPAIRELPLPLPPRCLQEQFQERHRAILDAGRRQREQGEQFAALFDSLVERAFRGGL